MSLTTIQKSKLQDIADAIRTRKSSSNQMTVAEMPEEIASIPGSLPSQVKTGNYTSNGAYSLVPDQGYTISEADITVNVPQTPAQTVSGSYSENGSYIITPDPGYVMDQVNVSVSVPPTPGQSKSGTYTSNGSYVIEADTGYLMDRVNLTVNVPSDVQPTQTKSETYTANGNYTVSPDTGYVLSQVGVSVNVPPTPSQTKTGTYTSNGTYSITPDQGYLIDQASITVNVPQIPGQSKSETITANGTYSITPDPGYTLDSVGLTVNVPSVSPVVQSKSETYTSNGTYTISPDSGYDYLSGATVTVNVPSSGGEFDSFSRVSFYAYSSTSRNTFTMDAMNVGESRIQDLIFHYPSYSITTNNRAYLPAGGTYELKRYGSTTSTVKNGGDILESYQLTYSSSNSGNIYASSSWVVTRLT